MLREHVGKLSCDFEGSPDSLETIERIEAFTKLVETAVPYLEYLFRAEVRHEASTHKIEKDILGCETLQHLFSYCTTTLRQLFHCKYASIFTVSEDSLKRKKLVLRKTSHPKLQNQENLRFYHPDDDALTTWIWRQRRTLRLHDLDDACLREQQLQTLHPRPKWKDHITDSDHHTTFLGVPICTAEQVLGVIRFTQKLGDEYLTDSDAVRLQKIASECIAPQLIRLPHAEFALNVVKNLQKMNKISEKDCGSFSDIPKELCGILKTFFPESAGSRKRYSVNIIEEGGQQCRTIASGNLGQHSGDLYPLKGSLTEQAISRRNKVLFLNDPAPIGAFRGIPADAAACAMACAINSGSQLRGTLEVFSEHHDLDTETHGRLLEVFAAQAGEMLARREIIGFSAAVNGLRHDWSQPLEAIEAYISAAENHGPCTELQQAASLVSFLQAAVEAYCRPGPPSSDRFSRFPKVPIGEFITPAIDAASVRHPNNCGIVNKIRFDVKARVYIPFLVVIVYNLVKNAFEHSPPGSQPVVVDAQIAGNWLELTVTDFGLGLTEEQAQHIFGSSWDLNTGRHLVGADSIIHGQGLFLSQKLAFWHQVNDGPRGELSLMSFKPRRLDGTLTREKDQNKSTCFRLRLPLLDGGDSVMSIDTSCNA